MSPQPSIARYRIVSKPGKGGMGAAYRATRMRLNRDVAVRALPERLPGVFGGDETEAATLASVVIDAPDLGKLP